MVSPNVLTMLWQHLPLQMPRKKDRTGTAMTAKVRQLRTLQTVAPPATKRGGVSRQRSSQVRPHAAGGTLMLRGGVVARLCVVRSISALSCPLKGGEDFSPGWGRGAVGMKARSPASIVAAALPAQRHGQVFVCPLSSVFAKACCSLRFAWFAIPLTFMCPGVKLHFLPPPLKKNLGRARLTCFLGGRGWDVWLARNP